MRSRLALYQTLSSEYPSLCCVRARMLSPGICLMYRFPTDFYVEPAIIRVCVFYYVIYFFSFFSLSSCRFSTCRVGNHVYHSASFSDPIGQNEKHNSHISNFINTDTYTLGRTNASGIE